MFGCEKTNRPAHPMHARNQLVHRQHTHPEVLSIFVHFMSHAAKVVEVSDPILLVGRAGEALGDVEFRY